LANSKRAKRTLAGSNKNLYKETGSQTPNPMPELSKAERIEVSRSRANDLAADTQAALERPSILTPRQLKARAISEALQANRKIINANRKAIKASKRES
jgi:hypothetical protein